VYYTVPSRETIYNICQRFKTSEKELLKLNPELSGGLRKGMILRIPLRINESDIPKPEEQAPGEVNAMLDSHSSKPLNASKIALLLPFNADNAERSDLSNRMVEYYEGMLLAADSFRNQGYATELFLYDIGEKTDKLQQLLRDKNDVFKSVNLIIGGWSNEQVKILSDYAGRNHIKYVIPITSKNDDVLNNAYIYQVNTPQQYLYDNASFAAAALFADHNIVFVDTQDKDEQSDFIKVFKRELNDRKISSATIVHNSSDFESKIIGALSKTKPNVVIPFSASIESLNKIKTVLRSIIQTKPEYKVTLFGYPKWQTYYKDCLDDFHELNTYIYSLFYADNIDPAVKQFYDNYKNWYSKTPMPSFPKYAMLGFDTGMFFLDALQKYGDNFENHISKMKYKSVQTGFNFERVNNWGGFINTNIYMIHFNKDFTITRSDFK
jgi:ABC-type branched-subunit amino acid transport system substrate-binding protein